jgi:outer membrane protein assembly factor BamB
MDATGDNGATGDPDQDGLTNAEEYANGTEPRDEDSDDDGMPDGWEVTYGLDPLDPADAAEDADGDGYSNLEEYQGGSDPQDESDVPNRAPYAPDNPSPSDGQDNVPVETTLTWGSGDPDEDELTFDIYFGDTYPPPLLETGWNPPILGVRSAIRADDQIPLSAWPMRGQNIQRTGRSRATGPAFSDNLWKFAVGEPIAAPVVVDSSNRLYAVTENGLLYAIGPDGEVKWTYDCGADVSSSPLVSAERTLYAVTDDGTVHAVSGEGLPLWILDTGAASSCSPAIRSDGRVLYVTAESRLLAIDLAGSVLWSVNFGSGAATSASVGLSGEIYVCSGSGALYRVSDKGSVDWSYQARGAIRGAPVIRSDGTVYFGCDGGNLYAVSADGVLKWVFKTDSRVVSSPVVGSGGGVYFGSADGSVYALTDAGDLKWSVSVGSSIRRTPALDAGSTVYVTTDDGCLYALDSEGRCKWFQSVQGAALSSPIIGPDGCVYLGSSDGNIYGFCEASDEIAGSGSSRDGEDAGVLTVLSTRNAETPTTGLRAARADGVEYAYDLPALTPGVQYYWRIVASDGRDETSGPEWSFRTSSAPAARFIVEPNGGTVDTQFHVDASTSSDYEDSIDALVFRWDWENDGTYDTDFTSGKENSHIYPDTGSYVIKLQVKDTADSTNETTQNVTVEPSFVRVILGVAVGLYYNPDCDLNGDSAVNAMDAIVWLQGEG